MRLGDEQVEKIVQVGRQVLHLLESRYTGETSNQQLADAVRNLELRGDEFVAADPLIVYIMQAMAVGIDALGEEYDAQRREVETGKDVGAAYRRLYELERAKREQLQAILSGRRTLCD